MFPARPRGLFGSVVPFPSNDDPANGGIAGNYPPPQAAQPAPAHQSGLQRALGIFADFAAGVNGRPGPYAAMMEDRRQEAQRLAEQQRQAAQQYALYDYKIAHPAPTQPSDFDQYAIAGGYQPGTPEWVALHRQRAEGLADPVVQTPNGMMLRSQALAAMQGQPAPDGVTFTPIPEGGPTPKSSGNFPHIKRYYGGQ